MKTTQVALLLVGAISAREMDMEVVQLAERVNAYAAKLTGEWDEEMEQHIDAAGYVADVPAGYDGPMKAEKKKKKSKKPAKPSSNADIQLFRHHKRHHHLSNQEKLQVFMQGISTIGVIDYHDTVDHLKEMINENSNEDEYFEGAPLPHYNAPYEMDALQVRTTPANWGNLDAGLDEHVGYITDSLNDHAHEEDYIADAPEAAVPYDLVQLNRRPVQSVLLGTKPENWGKVEVGLDEHRDYIQDFLNEHADETDYIADAPEAAVPYDAATLQLEKFGEIAYEDTAEHTKDQMHKGAHVDNYEEDIPSGYKVTQTPDWFQDPENATVIQLEGTPINVLLNRIKNKN